MKAYGQCRTGGAIEQSPIPYPIGKGLPRPTVPKPAPTPRGPKPRIPGEAMPSAQVQRICEAYDSGDPVREIAARLGIHRTTIYAALKIAGKPTRRAS